MKGGRRTGTYMIIVAAVAVAMIVGVIDACNLLGSSVVWSVYAVAMVAIAVTLVSALRLAYDPFSLHEDIERDLAVLSDKFERHFQDTLAAIQQNGEETRKMILAASSR